MAKKKSELHNTSHFEEPLSVPLDDKEMIFAESYLVNPNKANAARASGCPAKSAREQGYQIYNRPHVKTYIEKAIADRTMTGEETVKLVSDTAQSSLTDYFKPVKKLQTSQKKVSLREVIKQHQAYLEREYMFMDRKGLTEAERDKFIERLSNDEDLILKWEIELEQNPSASRIVDCEPKFVMVMELDINALVADKERGKVKKVKYSKDGSLEVEMYSALDAQEKLLKINGKYEKDNEQKKPKNEIDLSKLSDEAVNAILNASK